MAEAQANVAAGRCLVFCGSIGTGKTHLACAILHAFASKGARVRYLTVNHLIFRLRQSWAPDSRETEMELLEELCSRDLVVLDEVGVQFGTESERVQLFNVINARYNRVRPTIVISNLDLAGITAYLGERTVDRLKENAAGMVVLTGKSRRASQGR